MSINLEEIQTKALAMHHQGNLVEAERLYRQLLAKQPAAQEASNLGALLRSQGRLEDAVLHYHHWLERLPFELTLSLNAANCFREAGAYNEAQAILERGLAQHPNNSSLLLSAAETLLGQGDVARSCQLLRELTSREPGLGEAFMSLGVGLAKQADLEGALAAFERAHGINPEDSRIAANRVTMLTDLGRLDEADQLWSRMDAAQREDGVLRGALAGLRLAQQRFEEASCLLAKLASEEPHQPLHWLNWAACARGLKYTVAPHLILQRGLQWAPQHSPLHQALAQGLAEMGKDAATLRAFERLEQLGEELGELALFSRQFIGMATNLVPAEQRAGQARAWEQRQQALGLGPLWPDYLLEPLDGRRLRVGYLSADCANHPVGRYLLPILEHHNRSEVEVWVLSCGPHQDSMTDRLRQASDHWLELRGLQALPAGRLVADLRLDVLVELGGFTGHSRLDLLCQRPAPVQLSYLGYPAPTYLGNVDGWIGDGELFASLNPIDQTAHSLLELNGGYMAFDPGGELPIGKRTAGSKFRFGSFNHARKLSDACIALFCQVMEAVPEAELVLKSINFHEAAESQRVRSRFEAAGLAKDRLILLDWVDGAANHLKLYSEMDVALDPVPYGGATTTCEALWMGVPVVAMAGQGMVGRLSASLLVHGGCGDWLAGDNDGYVAVAKQLAQAGPRKRKQRGALRKRLEASPLADSKRLCQELERIFYEQRLKRKGP